VPERDERDVVEQPAPGQDDAALGVAARHALHEEELVAALAAGALEAEDDEPDRRRAQGLVARCPACRALHDDIAAIRAAARADATGSIPAPRDFRLTADDAIRLGGTVRVPRSIGAVRRLLAAFARPVGASLAAMGLVGILVGSAALGMGGVASAPAQDNAVTGGAVAPAATGGSVTEGEPAVAPAATKSAGEAPAEPATADRDAAGPGTVPWLLVLSIGAVLLGVGLFLAGVRAAGRSSTHTGAP